MPVVNVVFVEPFFPPTQRQFVRALAEVGANVIGIGESPAEMLDEQLRSWMSHYHQVPTVVDVGIMTDAVRWIQDKLWVDRLETTIEAHTMSVAQVRENCTIPGTSVHTAWLCRDKPSMKEALRAAGVPTAASMAADSAEQVLAFADAVGYPLILKPRSGAGAQDTTRVDNSAELATALGAFGGQGTRSIAVEEFVEGHEGFYDTLSVDGRPELDFVSHYFPNVLDAMRTRWISPQFISTNRVDTEGDYVQLREMGQRVNEALGHRYDRHAHGVVLRSQGAALLRDRLPSAGCRGVGPLLGRERHRRLPRVGECDRARPRRRATVATLRHGDRGAAAGPRWPDHRLLGCRRGAGPIGRVGDRRAPAVARHTDAATRCGIHGQRVRADAPP